MSNGFVHSVKVPRLYKTAASIVQKVREDGGSLKSLVYEKKHPNVSGVYALTSTTLQKEAQLVQLFQETRILQLEPRLNPWLTRVLITELLWGKKSLQTECKPIQTVLSYEKVLREALEKLNKTIWASPDKKIVQKPRYVRVNTILISLEEAILTFKEEGWTLLPKKLDYKSHLVALKNLTEPYFIQDFHIPELLIFPCKTHFFKHDAYKSGQILLQDKASCMPAHLLSPKRDSIVLDVCAAPGMKTTHLAAIMKNTGKIYAIEINNRRFTSLCEQVTIAGATCVEPINKDILTLTEQDCPNAEYILVDPSCSGSGMVDRQLLDGNVNDRTTWRLQSLQSFQVFVLRHVLSNFPTAKRVVYSTCSINPEENEEVICEILRDFGDAYKLVSLKDVFGENWINYSSTDYYCGDSCLYARFDVDMSTGFFVAMLERNLSVPLPTFQKKEVSTEENGEPVSENKSKVNKRKKRGKKNKSKTVEESQEESGADVNRETEKADELIEPAEIEGLEVTEESPRKKRKKTKHKEVEVMTIKETEPEEAVCMERPKKKSKHKKDIETETITIAETQPEGIEEQDETVPKKKKQKRSREKTSDESILDANTENGVNKSVSDQEEAKQVENKNAELDSEDIKSKTKKKKKKKAEEIDIICLE